MDNREKQLHIRLASEVYRELKINCALRGSSVQDYVAKLINENVQRSGGQSSDDGKTYKSTIIDLLHSCPLFSSTDKHGLDKLAEVATKLNYSKGRLIIQEGQIPQSLPIVKTGLVKIFKTFPSGKEFIFDICHNGEIFGEVSVIEGDPHSVSAQALEDTEIISIPRNDFLAVMAHYPDTMLKVASLEMLRMTGLYHRLIGLVSDNATQRVAKVLNALTLEYGDTLHLSHKEIAEMSGTTIETTTRILSKLKNDGIIRISRGSLDIIEKEKLKSY